MPKDVQTIRIKVRKGDECKKSTDHLHKGQKKGMDAKRMQIICIKSGKGDECKKEYRSFG